MADEIQVQAECTVLYDTEVGRKKAGLLSLYIPIGTVLVGGALVFITLPLFAENKLFYSLAAALILVLYLLYALSCINQYFRSRRDIVLRCIRDGDDLIVETDAGERRIALSKLVGTLHLSTVYGFCIVLVTPDDYVTVDCSSVHMFIREGKAIVRQYYALNKLLTGLSPRPVNVVKSRRVKQKNMVTIPIFLFEIEFYTDRAHQFVEGLRKKWLKEHTDEKNVSNDRSKAWFKRFGFSK